MAEPFMAPAVNAIATVVLSVTVAPVIVGAAGEAAALVTVTW